MRPAGVLVLAWLAACAPAEPFQARFAVRGRWSGGRAIAVRIDAHGGPLAPAAFHRAIAEALDAWQATGCVVFYSSSVTEPEVVLGWECGEHGPGIAFGADPGVAHAGPVGPGTFVHFDPARAWTERMLAQAALHEIGHVLGLDHSPDEHAALYAEPAAERDHLGASDLAALHSLYGGGDDGPGDVLVARDGERTLAMRAIAPAALTDWTLFDTDGDGDDELLVWRTDDAGHGALWTYHFAPGPVLAHTVGPAYGIAASGAELAAGRSADGERVLVVRAPGGTPRVLAFDERGLLHVHDGARAADVASRASTGEPLRGDLDGDGTPESVSVPR